MSERTASRPDRGSTPAEERDRAEQGRAEQGRSEQERKVLRRDAPRWLWFGVLGGPVAWAVHEVAAWLFVELTCTEGAPGFLGLSLRTISVLSTAIPLAIALAAWWVAWRAGRSLAQASAGPEPRETPRRLPRAKFMAQLGAWMAFLSIIMILYDGAAVLTLSPCAR
jgi:hypothetical protein